MKNNFRPLLSTTALARSVKLAVATGAMMLTSTGAWAVDDLTTPTGEVVVGGSASFDRPNAGQLNVNQNTDRVVINWNQFNIGAGATTQFYQPGSNSLAVNRVVGASQDPTQILGTLKANGRVMVLDRNGVLFGRDAVLDVGGIIASTGDIDTGAVMSGSNFLELKNFGDGSVVNEGSISVKDAGLAAFVGKHVANSGVINAKLGKVVLAAGSTNATVDLYGDGLVEFALDGDKTKVLAENSGVINAEGGTVALSASAAKDVVDNVINMSGIVNVSSVTVKGGKIILGGGKSGIVKVSGTLAASGEQGGGDVKVTGKNVEVTGTIVNNAGANGNGGNTLIYGDDYAVFNGNIFGQGGSVSGNGGQAEVSGGKGVGYYGYTDLSAANGEAGTLTIDPEFLTISNAAFNGNWMYWLSAGILGTVNVNDQAIANALRNNHVKLWASNTLSVTTDIDVSTWKQDNYVFNFGSCLFGCYVGTTKGITNKDLTLSAPTINLSNDITLGTGKLLIKDVGPADSLLGYGIINAPTSGINVDVVNLNGRIYKRSVVNGATTEAGDDQIDSQANVVNVQSSDARIQQGIYLANDDAQGIVNVAAGTYVGPQINVSKNVNIRGANADKHGTDATRGAESIVDPNSPGFYINAGGSGSIINGMVITGADNNGIWVDHASNVTLINNIIHDVLMDGILADTADGLIAHSNHIYNITSTADSIGSGFHIINTTGATIGGTATQGNVIHDADWDGVRLYKSTNITVQNNDIQRVDRSGLFFGETTGTQAYNNYISNAARWGINVDRGYSVNLTGNVVNRTGFDGIRVSKVKGALNTVFGNYVDDTGLHYTGFFAYDSGKTGHGIALDGVQNLNVTGNVIGGTSKAGLIRGDGIYGNSIAGAVIKQNYITKTQSMGVANGSGIHLISSNGATIGGASLLDGNVIFNTGWDGIRVVTSNGVTAGYNDIDNVYRTGIYFGDTDGAKILNNDVDTTTDRYGINVDGGSNVTVTGNDINNTNRHGIYVHGVKGVNLINANHVDTTHYGNNEGDGIHADSVSNLSILGNFVGLESGVDKIKGDGIFAAYTNGVVIKSNEITNTASPAYGFGSGIQLLNTDGATIGGPTAAEGNKIYKTGWDGVRVENVANVTVEKNDIDDVYRTGIFMGYATSSFVKNNFVTKNAERYGINVENGSDIQVTGNDIDNTQLNGIRMYRTKGTNLIADNYVDTTRRSGGIYAEKVSGLTIDGNFVGTDGVAGINGDGIFTLNSNGVVITSNEITRTKSSATGVGSGILVQDTTGATIGGPNAGDGNKIYNTGWDGIRVYLASNVLAQANDIDNVYRTGIYFGGVANGDIIGNFITGTTDRYGVNYDGGSDATISSNDVDNTNRHGIYIHGVSGVNLVDYNDVDFTNGGAGQGDGIHADDVQNLTIDGNRVGYDGGGIWGNGIFVDPSNGVQITDNVVNGAGMNGIYSLNNDDARILRNYVFNSTLNGILVEGGTNVTIGDYAPEDTKSNGNVIVNSGLNGILVDGTNGTIRIRKNSVTNSGTAGDAGTDGDGIQVRNVYSDYLPVDLAYKPGLLGFYGDSSVEIAANEIDTAHEDGIDVHDVQGSVYIQGNSISNIGFGGASASTDSNGHDGIYVNNVHRNAPMMGRAAVAPSGSYAVKIVNNDIDTTEDDGIEVVYSGRTLIQGNSIRDVGQGATYWELDGQGADGIHVRNVFNDVEYVDEPIFELMAFELAPVSDSAVEILGNSVNVDGEGAFVGNTADDGIQVVYSGNTVIDSNRVANSGFIGSSEEPTDEVFAREVEGGIQNKDGYGADGIHVLMPGGFASEDTKFAIFESSFSGDSADITNNFVDNSADDGIEADGVHFVTVDTNDVDLSGDVGILVRGYGSGYILPVLTDGEPQVELFAPTSDWTAIVTNNTVNRSVHDGVQIVDYDKIEASFNKISNSGNTPGYKGAGLHIDGAYNGNVNVKGNTLTDNRVGMEFNSGLIDLRGDTNTITRGEVGMRFSPLNMGKGGFAKLHLFDEDGDVDSLPTEAPANYGGTIGNQTFVGQSLYYVELMNGAFANTWVDGRFSSYDSFVPGTSLLTQTDYDLLAPKFWDWADNAGLGRFWGIIDTDLAEIPQERILNTFDAFGALGGEVNVVLLGLPPLPGGGNPAPTNVADFLNNLTPNAGEETGNPADIEPAAGGDEPAAGETTATTAQNNSSCWADATASAVAGSTTTFSFSSVINQTTLAQATNCGNGQPQ